VLGTVSTPESVDENVIAILSYSRASSPDPRTFVRKITLRLGILKPRTNADDAM